MYSTSGEYFTLTSPDYYFYCYTISILTYYKNMLQFKGVLSFLLLFIRGIFMTIKTGEKMYAADILNLTFFPKGAILTFSTEAWNNATNPGFKDIWKVCDGQNGTPNLVNMFLRGADSSGATGGGTVALLAANLPSHNHGATGLSLDGLNVSGLTAISDGKHTHTVSGSAANEGGHAHTVTGTVNSGGTHSHSFQHRTRPFSNGGTYGSLVEYAAGNYSVATSTGGSHNHTFSNGTTSGGGHTHSLTGVADLNGAHTHSITGSITGGTISGSTANAGSGQAFTIVPAYYTVIYIMKIA
jgi:hypothetical protein